ncbi:MAG: hypothetical protein AB7I01_24045, partial [Gammaproteobacteria bacterium]
QGAARHANRTRDGKRATVAGYSADKHKESPMAKGQLRSGREPKKPKQVKKPAATATTVFGGASAGSRPTANRGTSR